MSPARLLAPLLFAALAATPVRAQTPRIVRIQMQVVPEGVGGGHAEVTYEANGRIRGGHISPDHFVHQVDSVLTATQRRRLWAAARALGDSLLAVFESKPDDRTGVVYLNVNIEGSELGARFVWPFGGQHADPRVRRLAALVLEYRVGGW